MTQARRQAAPPRPGAAAGDGTAARSRKVIAGLLVADVAFAYQQTAIMPAIRDVERSLGASPEWSA
jgi:hypothetical protein